MGRAAPVLAVIAAPILSAHGPRARAPCAFDRIVAEQMARYPELEPQDLYKLALQAALGPAHALRDTGDARQALDAEVKDLAPGPAEPVADAISPGGAIVRVNLRPYLAAGGSLGALAAAFARSARSYRGSRARLREYLDCIRRMAGAGRIPLDPAGLRAYFAKMRRRGYPVPDHSAHYVEAYHPAYRVVLREFLALPGEAPRPR